jgi:hypothetical protein
MAQPELFVDGVEIKRLFVDSVEQDTLYADGVQVFQRGTKIIVTEGSSSSIGSLWYGYNDLVFGFGPAKYGSIDPTTFKGETLAFLSHQDFVTDSSFRYLVYLREHHPQNFFHSVLFEGASLLLTASADFFLQTTDDAVDDITIWSWFDVPDNTGQWDGSGSSSVILYED